MMKLYWRELTSVIGAGLFLGLFVLLTFLPFARRRGWRLHRWRMALLMFAVGLMGAQAGCSAEGERIPSTNDVDRSQPNHIDDVELDVTEPHSLPDTDYFVECYVPWDTSDGLTDSPDVAVDADAQDIDLDLADHDLADQDLADQDLADQDILDQEDVDQDADVTDREIGELE